jgi:oligopeptide/dipeptide ABC transporter ATP-binding protein
MMGLLGENGRVTKGQVAFNGKNLLALTQAELDHIRGDEITMIFQDAMTSLNPVFTIGSQLTESIRVHMHLSKREATARASTLLVKVGLSDPFKIMRKYPHTLSGGMRQRVMIAMALAWTPALLVADEPTTALDVTIQAQILDLLGALQQEFKMAVILITHDLGVVAQFVDKVAVMYAGRLVETGTVTDVFDRPTHPYTEGLLASIPSLDVEQDRLASIPGTVPSPFALPRGCRFGPRCAHVRPACDVAEPPLIGCGEEHAVACIRPVGYRVGALAS